MKEKYMSRVSLQRISGRSSRLTWGRKDEEYVADFYLVSKRHLDDTEFQVFKFHFLYGADWKLCCRKFNLDRGNFFHAVYRIQQKLGRVFRELAPYSLYPLDEYFNGALRREIKPEDRLHQVPPARLDRGSRPVTPPVKLAA
jgi:hypothetical protein